MIVNLQWTPKDSQAVLKIGAKSDAVMRLLAAELSVGIPTYSIEHDALFALAVDDVIPKLEDDGAGKRKPPGWLLSGVKRK